MALEFGLLGPIDVRQDGETIALGGPQQRRILAVLLAESGRVVSVERLVDAIWPEEPPEGARRTVMVYVSRLRMAMGDGYVETQDPGYRLAVADEAIDAVRFERLVEQARRTAPTQAITIIDRALALWRGQAFGEFAADWWALPHAIRLEELRIVASEERVGALIAAGEYERAVTDLEGLVAAYPLRERPVAQLMKAYAASGRQAEALRAYTRFREHLGEETGLEPSGALHELEASIVTGASAGTDASRARSLRGYVLGPVLGEGAFGTVYQSTQPGVGRDVAVKVIRADLADDPAFVRRFEAEAQLVAHLEHPHIVPLYDFWREPGGAYLVFRLLRGGNAEQLIRRDGPWELERVTRVVTEIGGALVTAHTAGVVHRDVKPANVLFDEAGNAYLSDFGIAATDVWTDAGAPAEAGASAGSPLYAPPEQFQRGAPTARADQYSFAAMVWELLSGVPPYDGDSVSTILRTKLQRPVPPLRAHRPDVPQEIEVTLQRATASRPEDRYDDMTALTAAWQAAVRAPIRTTGDLAAIRTQAGATRDAASTLAQLADAVANPYKGLRAFGEADARHFHGRAPLVAELVEAVRKRPFVAVVGASGSGKSSVVHAGLVPRLRAADMRVISMVPGDDPFAQLRLALLTAAIREPDAGGVVAMVRSVAAQATEPLVLVIDQFEELWTLAGDDERDRFLAGFRELASEHAELPVHVVVAIRADFFDRPLAHPALGPLVATSPIGVTPMSASELHEAIAAPAAELGVAFEPGLDSEIVADVVNQPASLPLLQFTLAELFERRRGVLITRATYASIGGIAGAIASEAEQLYASLDPPGQDAARRLFLRLVVPGDGTEDTRRRVRRSDLPPGADDIADRFEARRLLVADRDPSTREPTVEVAHESLLRSWPRLRGWLAEDRDWIRRLQHVGAAAGAWAAADRPESELYRGARLDAATEILESRADQLTGLEREFIDASGAAARAAEERERRARHRLRRGFVATSVALVIALIAGGVAIVQRGNAQSSATKATVAKRAAEVEALVGRTAALRSTQRDAAALLAIEAFRLADTPRTRSALLSTFTENPGFLDAHQLPPDNDLYFGIVLPDGSRALVTTRDHRLREYDLDSGELGAPWEPMSHTELRYSQLFASRDSRLLAQIADDESVTGRSVVTIGVFDIAGKGLRFPAIDLPMTASAAVFSPDDKMLLVSGGANETVIAFDTTNGRELGRVAGTSSSEDPQDLWGSAGLAFVGNRQLAIGSRTGRVRIVDVPSMDVEREFTLPAETSRQLDVVDGGRSLLGRGFGGIVRFDTTTGARAWVVDAGNCMVAATVLSSRHRFYCADDFGRLDERDLDDGHITRRLDAQKGAVGSVWPARHETEVVNFGNGAPVVTRWRVDGTGPITRRLPPGHSPFGYSPDGTKLTALVPPYDPNALDPPSADADVLDATSGEKVDDLGKLVLPVWDDNSRLGGATRSARGYNVAQYDLKKSAIVAEGPALPVAGLRGGLDVGASRVWAFYGTSPKAAEVWTIDPATRKRVDPTIKTDPPFAWAATRDGTLLAIATNDVVVYDTTSGKEVGRVRGRLLHGVNITDTGVLVAWTLGGELTMYDLRTLELLHTLPGSRGYLVNVQSDTRGTALAALGGDRTVAIYDLATAVAIGDPIAIPDDEVNAIAFRRDGRELAVGGSLRTGMQIWDLDPQHWIDAACRVAGRNLTRAQWQTNIGSLLDYRSTCDQFPAGS